MSSESRNWTDLARALGVRGRVGRGQLVGTCPIHKDRHPSFSMSTETGLWTCFSQCGTGNFYHLVQKALGMTLAEAHDWVIQNSSVQLVPFPVKVHKYQDGTEIEEWRTRFLLLGRTFMPVFWFDRGFTWETAAKYDVRWDPQLEQLVIPFCSGRDLLGTVRRNLRSGPKYQNSPGLPRSEFLFNLPAQASGPLILIVEGALDALWAEQCGYFPASALLGLSMTEPHVRLLHGFTEICLALDNDAPGQGAIQVAAELLRKTRPIWQVTRLVLPEHRKDVGETTPEELEIVIKNRKPA